MITGEKTGRFLIWFTSIAVALVSWRFFVLGLEAAFPSMEHQLSAPRMMFYAHVVASPLALLIMPFQLSAKFRARRPNLHRWFGRIYCLMVLIGGIGGMAIAFSAKGGLVVQAGFFFLSVFWLAATVRAYVSIRAGRIADHRAWMIRSAALTFAAVTLRLWLPLQLVAGVPYDIAYAIVAWLAWVPNLIVAEYLLRRLPPAAGPSPALA